MGREVKRVSLDFKWPIDQIWKGYLNPYHSQNCKGCDSTGYNPETKKISDDWYDFDNTGHRWCNNITDIEVEALVKSNRLYYFTHVFVPEEGYKEKEPKYIPTAKEVNEWSKKGFGHDGLNRMICVEARAKHLGVYGLCEFCEGSGEIWQSKEVKQLHEDWKPFDPPSGNGFQLWSTTTEGHPMSPVFETPEELAHWLAENNASAFGSMTATYEQWLSTIKNEFAPSLVVNNGVIKSGVQSATDL